MIRILNGDSGTIHAILIPGSSLHKADQVPKLVYMTALSRMHHPTAAAAAATATATAAGCNV